MGHVDRSRFSFKEVLTADVSSPGTNDDKLNLAFDRVEASANERQLDLHPYGVISGLSVTEAASPNMTVRVATGVAQDQTGQRIEIASTQSVDILTDYQGNAISLPNSGQEKYASVFLKFKRLNQNARQDDNSVSYYQDELENFEIRVRAGSSASAGTATPPALQGSEILLADVLLAHGMTQVEDADIELDDRRQDAWKLSPSNADPQEIRVGTAKAAATLLLSWVNDILDGTLSVPAGGVTWTRGNGADSNPAAFADGTAPSNGAVGLALDWLISRLGGIGGANGVGAARIGMDATANWADSSSSFSAGPLRTVVAGIISTLASSVGLVKIGGAAVSGSPTSLSAGTAQSMIAALLAAVNLRALAAFTPTGGISSTTVHTAIAELDTEKAALAGATFTGEVRQPRANLGVQAVGVIAANTQITNDVGIVICQCPGSNSANFNLAMPAPAAGNPVLFFKFYGGTGSGRRVWLTTTANIGGSPPTDYFAYWDASVDALAGAIFVWDGTRWRHLTSSGMTATAGGGSLAE